LRPKNPKPATPRQPGGSYTYDSYNRPTQATEIAGAATTWSEGFSYDSYSKLRHGTGLFSRGKTMSFTMFWNKDLMNEGQGMPTSSSPRK
jgi:hypothetical protein